MSGESMSGAVPQAEVLSLRMEASELKGKVDFAILTIREDENKALLRRLPGIFLVDGRRRYRASQLPLADGTSYMVVTLRCVEQGNAEALNATRDLLEDLDPAWLLVVGIAGGVPSSEFSLGDVIVSTRVADFSVEAVLADHTQEYALAGGPLHIDAAKLVADIGGMAASNELVGWNSRSAIGMPRPRVRVSKELFYGDDKWRRDLREKLTAHFAHKAARPARVLAGAIASSDRLIKDAQLLRVWLRMARQVQAIEMESGGIYRAAHGRVPFLAIRGISDVVGYRRQQQWTAYACETAAAFTLALLLTRPVVPRSTEPAKSTATTCDGKNRSRRPSCGRDVPNSEATTGEPERFDYPSWARMLLSNQIPQPTALGRLEVRALRKADKPTSVLPRREHRIRDATRDAEAVDSQSTDAQRALHELLHSNRRVLLVGGAGYGKTTFLRHEQRRHAEFVAEGSMECLIPVFADLATYTPTSDLVEILRGGIPKAIFERDVSTGRILLLADGLSEILPSEYESALRQLSAFVNRFPALRAIIASRLRPNIDLGAEVLELMPFSKKQSLSLLARHLRNSRCLADSQQATLLDRLLDETSNTPFLLDKLVTVLDEGSHVPSDLLGILREWIQFMCRTLDYETRDHVLPALAYGLSNAGRASVPQETLPAYVEHAIQVLISAHAISGSANAARIVQELHRTRIVEASAGARLCHQTIQDYLSAVYMTRYCSASELAEVVQPAEWELQGFFGYPSRNKSETVLYGAIPFVLGLLDGDSRTHLLRAIADRDVVFACKCLGLVGGDQGTETVEREIVERLTQMLRAKDWRSVDPHLAWVGMSWLSTHRSTALLREITVKERNWAALNCLSAVDIGSARAAAKVLGCSDYPLRRIPYHANKFYAGDPQELRRRTSALIGTATVARPAIAAISPCAGHIYAGSVFGKVFASIRIPEVVVVVGTQNYGYGQAPACSIRCRGSWEIPTGVLSSETELAMEILDRSRYLIDDGYAHRLEFSVESVLPFVVQGNPSARIVPIVLASVPRWVCSDIAGAIAAAVQSWRERVLVVGTATFTKYLSSEEAQRDDMIAINRLQEMDADGLYALTGTSQSGLVSCTTVLETASLLGASTVEVVAYADSSAVSSSSELVVSYAGVVFR